MTADLIAPSHGHPPIRRRHTDIIAGQDFLSVFMSASGQMNTKTTTELIITTPNESPLKPVSRDSRSSLFHEESRIENINMDIPGTKSKTPYLPLETMFSNVKDSDEDDVIDEMLGISNSDSFGLKTESKKNMTSIIQSKLKEFYTEHQNLNENNRRYDSIFNNPLDSEAQVIAVRVSSSVGISQINKSPANSKTTTTTETISQPNEQNAVPASEDPIINAQSNKSEFTIEEREPATKDKDYIRGSATNRHSVVAPGPLFGANEAYLQQQRSRHQRRQEPMHPYHQTIIYHNSQKDGNQPRSISYSSMGQSVHPAKPMEGLNTQPGKETDNISKGEKHYSQPAQVYSEPAKVYGEPEKVYGEPAKVYSEPAKNYGEPAKIYSEPAKIYSEPAKVYSEPEKVYSEPAKIYSEPAKIYSEPAKVYSEPAKIYSEPAKVYSQPERVYHPPQQKVYGDTEHPYASKMGNMYPRKEYVNAAVERYMHQNVRPEDAHLFGDISKPSYDQLNAPKEEGSYVPRNQERNWAKPERVYGKPEVPHVSVTDPTTGPRPQVYETTPEQNYEVDEAVSVMTNGRAHGVQPSPDKNEDDSQKTGYVVEGKNFRKYRVEERTSDGFIVGEYGVVSHDDGSLRGVRYTADGTINPRLIYDALMKFLAL